MTDPSTDPADTPATDPPTDSPGGQGPRWDGDFDPDRAARLVENLRAELADVKTKLRGREDAEKSDQQKLTERAEAAERELITLRTERLISAAARKHHLPDELVEFVTGSTEADIDASAARVAERFGSRVPAADVPARPRPRLVPGHGSEPATDFDAAKVAGFARRA